MKCAKKKHLNKTYTTLNMKFTCLMLFALFLSLPCPAQVKTENAPIVKDTAYEAIYNKYKAMYIKQQESESHKKYIALHKAFVDKMHADETIKFEKGYSRLQYIKANLANTGFKSYEEAEKEWEVCTAANAADINENRPAKNYMIKILMANPQKNAEIIQQVMIDVAYEKRQKDGN